jgi:hypothetical protein
VDGEVQKYLPSVYRLIPDGTSHRGEDIVSSSVIHDLPLLRSVGLEITPVQESLFCLTECYSLHMCAVCMINIIIYYEYFVLPFPD